MQRNKDNIDKLEELIRQAWTLTETEIESIQPGNIDQAISILDNITFEDKTFNKLTPFEIENPDVHLINLMRNPEFFPFTCKHLFSKPDGMGDLEILPVQNLVLKELWTRQFPILIANRGFGKCIAGDSLIMTNNGISRIKDFVGESEVWEKVYKNNEVVYGESGYKSIEYSWNNGLSPTIKLKTSFGFSLEGTLNHPIRILDENDNIKWENLENLKIGDKVVIDRSDSWFENTNNLTKEEAYNLGFNFCSCCFPDVILQSSKESCASFLSGLMDANARFTKEDNFYFSCIDTNVINILQFILTRFGIISKIEDGRFLYINDINLYIFKEKIGFKLKGQQDKLLKCMANKLCDIKVENYFYDKITDLSSSECVTYDMYVPDGHSFVSNGIISHNTFLLALYILLRLLFTPGSKVVIVASAFRQAKVVFEYMEKLWYTSPIFRSLVGTNKNIKGRENGPRRDIDRCEFIIGDSVAIAIPLGMGNKIRGLRANYIITEEFSSVSEDIYSIVIQGFGSVTADPIQNVKDHSRMRVLKRLGLWTEDMQEDESNRRRGNQSVLSGTAYYSFNHFCKYWKEYKQIIESKGDKKVLQEIFKGPVPEGFDWRDYSVIRVPVELVPKGYMDEKTLIRAKQINHISDYLIEYGCIFMNDSDGFFKRSLIEKCVVGRNNPDNIISHLSCGIVDFTAMVSGNEERKYVYGIDPASERDQFAVVILEIWPDHRRIVYCWTTSKSDHRERLKKGLVKEHDFYRYCVRKIRDLKKSFPCETIMIDAGGGGISLREAFGDPDKLEVDEMPIYEVIDYNKPKDTDDMPGEHLIQLVQFRDTAWVSGANHGMKKDMEDKVLLFPMIDSLALGMAEQEDIAEERIIINEQGERSLQVYDTLENAMLEIEELKNELSTIILTTTPKGLEHWDTPDKKTPGQKKGVLRKDRYSALLIANMGARIISRTPELTDYEAVGGFAKTIVGNKNKDRGKLYIGPSWVTEKAGSSKSYGKAIRLGGVKT